MLVLSCQNKGVASCYHSACGIISGPKRHGLSRVLMDTVFFVNAYSGLKGEAAEPCNLVSCPNPTLKDKRTIPRGILQAFHGLLCLSELSGSYGAFDHLILGNLLVCQVAIQSKQSESNRPGAMLPLPKERICCLLYFIMIEIISRASFMPKFGMCWQNSTHGVVCPMDRLDSFLLQLKDASPRTT